LKNFTFLLPQFGQAEPRSAAVYLYGSVVHTTAAKIFDKKSTSYFFLNSPFDKKDSE
jgi:hypothetical protein